MGPHAIARLAADYLVEKGRQRFVFVADVVIPASAVWQRDLFRQALAAHGYELLACDLTWRPEGFADDLVRAGRESGMARLLREAPKPLAVFATTDNHARVVCRICQEQGLDVPGEVAILGCGNHSISCSNSPTISSVHTDNNRIGYEAMKLLHHLIDGGRPPAQPILIPPFEVIERQSTCADCSELDDVRRAQAFIREHACEGITVKEVVNNLSMSRRTLEKHFRERIGHSPGEEIKQLRLTQARTLLTETDLSITRVSAMTGFREPTRFSLLFRKLVGLTPSDYRERARRKNP